MGQMFSKELIFARKEFWKNQMFFLNGREKFTFFNTGAVQTTQVTNELWNKDCAKENGLLAKLIRS